nr:hypothetical protein [Desulfolutivibrio sulfoxidireducens]
MASSGQVHMLTLQRLLTHKSANMTRRYSHLRDDALRRASDVAGKFCTNPGISGIKKDAENLKVR